VTARFEQWHYGIARISVWGGGGDKNLSSDENNTHSTHPIWSCRKNRLFNVECKPTDNNICRVIVNRFRPRLCLPLSKPWFCLIRSRPANGQLICNWRAIERTFSSRPAAGVHDAYLCPLFSCSLMDYISNVSPTNTPNKEAKRFIVVVSLLSVFRREIRRRIGNQV